ncbi:MAG TPA: 30S ribosomal protein S1 [Nitrospiria bacterium]|nr:30S ribosomal protein S1 [Nitrospiria bacterium]
MTFSEDAPITNTAGATNDDLPMNMHALYEESFKNLKEGGVVEGMIVAIQQAGVVVDIGYKSEGLIPASEFSSTEIAALKVGEQIQVYLEEREDNEGNLILSKEKAAKMKVWEVLEKSFEKAEVVDGKMVSKVKGGMMVDIGVKAFLPGSQIDLHPVRDLDALIGKTFPMKIIKMNHRRGNIVVSRRVLLEESRDKKRRAAMATLEDGQLIEGMVKNITEYGAFIDLGGIDGLLHITDMSWGRVNHPSEILSVGDRIGVVVLKYDKETGRVSLGLKQKTPDPWGRVEEKYPVATRVKGKIVSITDYGAFVELEAGIEGLVHISEMSWSHEVRHPSKLVSVGDQVEVVVLMVDRDNRKISLGMKQVTPNPWSAVEGKYPVGSRITGKIKGLTDFGAFVGLEEGIDGLIHISDMSWTKRLTHPSELFKKGQPVEAVVLKVDKEKERLSLGYKQLQSDPWETGIAEKYHVGDVVKCKIVKVTDFGVFVELEDGVEGLIHVSETGIEPSSRIGDAMQINDVIRAQIIKMDMPERKIALSIRAYKNEQERAQKKDKK